VTVRGGRTGWLAAFPFLQVVQMVSTRSEESLQEISAWAQVPTVITVERTVPVSVTADRTFVSVRLRPPTAAALLDPVQSVVVAVAVVVAEDAIQVFV